MMDDVLAVSLVIGVDARDGAADDVMVPLSYWY
jgi:hypothetical protein